MSFDLAVSRAVALTHALERAIHDPGPWTIELDGLVVPAARFVGDWSVTFTAMFPSCAEGSTPILRSRGEYVRTRASVSASDVPFEYRWELSLPTEVRA